MYNLTTWPGNSVLRTLQALAVITLLSACGAESTDDGAQENGPQLSITLPQKIRNVAAVVPSAVGAEVESGGFVTSLTRQGNQFTGTVQVEPGSPFSYRLTIFELVDGNKLELAEQSGNLVQVDSDTTIAVQESNYTFPDIDGDQFTNLAEREAGSDPVLSSSTPNNIGSPPDLSPGLAQFTQSEFRVSELMGSVAIRVERRSGSSGIVSANYQFSDETATAGADYVDSAGTITWSDGDTSPRTIFLTINQDDDFERDQSFIISLSARSGGLAIGNGRARITIEDSTPEPQPGTLQLTSTIIETDEDSGTVAATVERVGGSDRAVSVSYRFIDGSADNGSDYSAQAGTLSWADGNSAPQQIPFSLINDALDEDSEAFLIELADVTGGAGLGLAQAEVRIADTTPTPEPGALTLSTNNYQFTEGATASVTIVRTGGTDGEQTIDYQLVAGTATAGEDFNPVSGTLIWTDGESGSREITFAVNADNIVEGNETLALSLDNASGGATVPITQANIVISDDTILPVPGNIQVSADSFTLNEGESLQISIERLNGQDGNVGIDYALEAGIASAGDDFQPNTGTLQWGDGDTTNRTVSVSAFSDETNEAIETLTLTLTNPSGGASLLRDSATINIVDATPEQTPGQIQLAVQDGTVDEGSSQTIIVQRVGGTDGEVSVDVEASPGTAVSSDFSISTTNLSWSDGDASDRIVTLNALVDDQQEPAETLTVQLSQPTGGASLGQASLTVTINDTTQLPLPGRLEFAASDGLLNEGGTITLQVARSNGGDGAVTVDWFIAGGSADSADHNAANGGTLSWPDGDTASRSINIVANADTQIEGNESLIVDLSNPGGGATLGLASLTVTIIDNTPQAGTFAFATSSDGVTEGESASIVVSRNDGTDGLVSVVYSVTGGTADAADHNQPSGTFSWPAGDDSDRIITLISVDDDVVEGAETAVLTLDTPTGGATIGSSTFTLTINDNTPQPQPGTLAFTTDSQNVTEGETAALSVQRSNGSDGAIFVAYSFSNGTADAADHRFTSGTLNWADGESGVQTISAPTNSDDDEESAETVTFALSNPQGGATLGQASLILTIVDNPPLAAGTLSLTSASGSVSEGGSENIIVTRTGGSDGAVSIDYSYNNISTSDDDHNQPSGTLNWGGGDNSSRTIAISGATDLLTEGDESLTLELSNPGGGAALNISTTTVIIADVAPASAGQLSLTATSASVAEGANVNITAARTGGTNGAVSVDFGHTNISTSNSDHNSPSGTLNWADGEGGTKTINVSASTDAEADDGESLQVDLNNATGGATLGQSSVSISIIDVAPVSAGTLAFATPTLSVAEGETLAVQLTRSSGSDGAVQLDYQIDASSSADSNDHNLSDGSVNWADGDDSVKTVLIDITDDGTSEDAETLVMNLLNATNEASIGTATVTITITDAPLSKLADNSRDGQWQVCYPSTGLNHPSAWSLQYNPTTGGSAVCVKACGEYSHTDNSFAGWGYDPISSQRCVITDSVAGKQAVVPIYTPERQEFDSPEPEALASGESYWRCRLQQRVQHNHPFTTVSTARHWFDLSSDGYYQFAQNHSDSAPTVFALNGLWSVDQRELQLDHLHRRYQNVVMQPDQTLYLYHNELTRYSCDEVTR